MELALTSTNDLDSIRNGMIENGVGHRAVSFSIDPRNGNLYIRSMISLKNAEKYYGWNSGVQSLKIGDFVVISSWDNKRSKLELFRNTTKGLVSVRTFGGIPLSKIKDKLPPSIVDFLKPRGGGPSYLPTGYWRANYDMISTLPSTVITAFLSQYLTGQWLTYAIDEAAKVPEQHLITDWKSRHVKPLPKTMTNHCEFWEKELYSKEDYYVHNSNVWILIHANGEIELHEIDETSGHYYVGPSRRVVETFKAMPKVMPATVVKAIQLNLGAYEKDERSYGARWYLYKR